MSLRLRAGLAAVLWVWAGAVAANAEPRQARPMAQDPALEARLVIISEELRCLVCQNESLASSNAELAQDLRNEVRDLMRQGKSDAEVKQFLVQRYGDFVLYRPEFKPLTYLLWAGPFVLLLLGLLVLWRVLRLRRQATVSTRLSPEERRKAEQLLKDAS
jgi:cytochrome c-type biogenesis protein CcmH